MLNRRTFFSALAGLPFVGRLFREQPPAGVYASADASGDGIICSIDDKPPVSLFINGVEVPFDCTKILKLELRANVSAAEMGPIQLAFSPKDKMLVSGTDENPFGLLLATNTPYPIKDIETVFITGSLPYKRWDESPVWDWENYPDGPMMTACFDPQFGFEKGLIFQKAK